MNQILHLGLGSFHRAHQAVYLQRLIERGETDWTLVGGNIRADMAETLAALAAQNGEYTLETVAPDGQSRFERIRSISRVVPYDDQLAGLIALGAAPETKIISFTVTEAGYYLDAAHHLDPSYAEIQGDIAGRTRCTIYGALAAILAARRERGSGPVTLLNCDNLRSNGERVHTGLTEFIALRGERELGAWVEANTTCPNAMVDRITPRPAADLPARVKAETGWDDRAPVMGERFIQWVIEDRFAAGRPAWEHVGAEMVSSVLPYEEAKIRVLNAPHSCIAWAGSLIGLTYIHEGVLVPAIRRMAWEYVTEDVIPVLSPSPIDLGTYRDVVLDRFSNAHLRDTNQRVAMDGFSKIPGFIVPTIRERLARGESIARVAVLPALFYHFMARWHRGELAYEYQDGVMDRAAAHAIYEAADPLAAFARDPVLWGPLAGNDKLSAALVGADREVKAFIAGLQHG